MRGTTLLVFGILFDALVGVPLAIAFQPWTLAMLLPVAVGMMLVLSERERQRTRVRA
jgi:hypothetical protein